jgi:hypothetical protein
MVEDEGAMVEEPEGAIGVVWANAGAATLSANTAARTGSARDKNLIDVIKTLLKSRPLFKAGAGRICDMFSPPDIAEPEGSRRLQSVDQQGLR